MTEEKKPPFFSWRTALLSAADPTSTDRLVALVISTWMNEWGLGAFPSQETIAQKSGLTERSVREAVKRLRSMGWIRTTKERAPGQRFSLTHYAISFPGQRPEGDSGSEKDALQASDGEGCRDDILRPEGDSGRAHDRKEIPVSDHPPESPSERPESDNRYDRKEVPTISPDISPREGEAPSPYQPSEVIEKRLDMLGLTYTQETLEHFRTHLEGKIALGERVNPDSMFFTWVKRQRRFDEMDESKRPAPEVRRPTEIRHEICPDCNSSPKSQTHFDQCVRNTA